MEENVPGWAWSRYLESLWPPESLAEPPDRLEEELEELSFRAEHELVVGRAPLRRGGR